MKLDRKKAIVLLGVAAVLWSTGGLLIKLLDWSPVAISSARSGIAALVMLAYLRRIPKRVTPSMGVGAVMYTAMVILFVLANKTTTAANAILLQYSAPIWVALLAGWFLKETVTRKDWMTIAVVMGGMVLFFMGDLRPGQMMGNGFAILSGVALASVVVCMKLQKENSAVEMTLIGNVVTFLIGIPFLASVALDVKGLIGILLLGVFQLGISYILYAEAVKHVTAVEAILIALIEPILNPVWVFLATGEAPSAYALAGGAVVLGVVTLRSIRSQERSSVEESK